MKNRLSTTVLGVVLLFVIMAISWVALSWIVRSILGLDKSVVSAIIAGAIAVFSLIFTYLRDREKARQEAHREKKVEIYSLFFDIIFRGLQESKKEADSSEYWGSTELQENLLKIMKGILSYGSPNVVLAFNKWKAKATDSPTVQMICIGDLMLAMRKDLGLSNTGLTNANIHQIYVSDDVEAFLKGSN